VVFYCACGASRLISKGLVVEGRAPTTIEEEALAVYERFTRRPDGSHDVLEVSADKAVGMLTDLLHATKREIWQTVQWKMCQYKNVPGKILDTTQHDWHDLYDWCGEHAKQVRP
jgi:hypothetical protein